MYAVLSSENEPTASVAVGRSECLPEDQVVVMVSVLAVAGLGTRDEEQKPSQAALLFWGWQRVCVALTWDERR